MASARQISDPTHQHKHGEAPFDFEQTLRLQNDPDKQLPDAVKGELSVARLYLRGITSRRDIDDYLVHADEAEDAWSVRLPAGASLGMPGKTGERLHRSALNLPQGTSTPPHRPEWSGHSYQPRVAGTTPAHPHSHH